MFSASTTGPVNVFELKPIHSTSYLLKPIHSTSCLKPAPPLCWVPVPPCPSKPMAVLIPQVPSAYLLSPACPLPPARWVSPPGYVLSLSSPLFLPFAARGQASSFPVWTIAVAFSRVSFNLAILFLFWFYFGQNLFFPLTTPFGVWNLSSLTRTEIRFLASESAESQPSDCYLHGHP